MSLRKIRETTDTLSFRLVLWYTAIFALSSLLAFGWSYLMIASHLRGITDGELLEKAGELEVYYAESGIEGLLEELEKEGREEDLEERYYRLLAPGGEVLFSTDLSAWEGLPSSEEAASNILSGGQRHIETMEFPRKEYEARVIAHRLDDDLLLDAGMSVEHEEEFLEVFRRIFSLSVSAMILFAAVIGWFMSRRALKEVEEVTQTAIRIKSGSLKERVPLKSRGLEVETLAHTFNEMLDHIETLIVEMRTLTDNLAHDMRNPLTSLRGKAELALTSGKGREELKSITAFTVEECDRLLQMINSMLDLAEADSGALKLTCEEIELADLAGDGVEIFEPLAEERDIGIVSEIPVGLRVEADRQGLQRIVGNLLDNAVKYSSLGGKVVLSARNREEMVELRVTDEGMGIAPDEVKKIFTRFYRSDKSRSARGVGLGLSLARAIARAHRGDVTVESDPGKGSVFILSLPRLSRSA